MQPTRLIAHRGASGWAPEHTETAVRLAARLGADAVERIIAEGFLEAQQRIHAP